MIPASALRGMPKPRAELYGKPHLGCRYTHGGSYEALQPVCCLCGRRACELADEIDGHPNDWELKVEEAR